MLWWPPVEKLKHKRTGKSFNEHTQKNSCLMQVILMAKHFIFNRTNRICIVLIGHQHLLSICCLLFNWDNFQSFTANSPNKALKWLQQAQSTTQTDWLWAVFQVIYFQVVYLKQINVLWMGNLYRKQLPF